MKLPLFWEHFLEPHFDFSLFYENLNTFVGSLDRIIPQRNSIFKVFEYMQPQDVRCVLFGEDPYPRISSACGVAFWDLEINSWDDKTNGNSLKNILKALLVSKGKANYSTPITHCREIAKKEKFYTPPDLFTHWLNQGILLVNTSLTFSGNKDKKKHMDFWLEFHKALIRALNIREQSPFYILWGNKAGKWEKIILETIDNPGKVFKQGHPTFIHQFLDKTDETYSPFNEIINKTRLNWI